MLGRKKTGAVLCASCGKLVGVHDEICWNCGRRNPGLWGFAPMLRNLGSSLGPVTIIIWGCAALYLASLLVDVPGIGMSGLSFLSPSIRSLFLFGASGALPVFGYGRWWTILSAGWLHGSLLHIVFNLMWVRYLAPAAVELYGASRMAIIYTLSSATGFMLSSVAGIVGGSSPLFFLRGAQITLGASAPIFGLLGLLVAYGQRTGSSHVSGQAWGYAVITFVFGLIMPGIDNYAHLGGFLGGYASAWLLNPMHPESFKHAIAALLLLALTALSIVLSIVPGILPR